MFNSGIRGNQRCNGLVSPSTLDPVFKTRTVVPTNYTKLIKTTIGNKDGYNHVDSNHHHPHHQTKVLVGPVTTSSSSFYNGDVDVKVKQEEIEDQDFDFENKITAHSIIGLSEDYVKAHNKTPLAGKSRLKHGNIRATHHETLQRIEKVEEDFHNHYQHYWFSASLEKFKLEDRSREERIEITRHEVMRHLQQILRSNVGRSSSTKNSESASSKTIATDNNNDINNGATTTTTTATSTTSKPNYHPHYRHHHHYHKKNRHQKGYDKLPIPTTCDVDGCLHPALPCTRHCSLHVMLNADQVLFGYCTAKFADNTQCSVPVFDITHELPLCPEHARKRDLTSHISALFFLAVRLSGIDKKVYTVYVDNYKMYQEAKPKKLRKKVKPSAMIRPQKRSKRKKKHVVKSTETTIPSAIIDIPIVTSDTCETVEDDSPELEEDIHMVVDNVLGLNETDALAQVLETQASHLLEETDINTVLSTIQVDEFSDFFTVNRNGEYEPSREEAEELEKALAAVDNDVKSLEKLSQTHGLSHGLLDSLLDEHALAESLVQIPDVFHNGYVTATHGAVPTTDNIMMHHVTQATASYLLPVEPQSHS